MSESWILETPDGRIITKKPLTGRDYFKFKATLTKKDLGTASQELMLKMFEVDGQPLTVDLLDDPYPEGLGFETIAKLDAEINAIFTDSQSQLN